MMNPIQQSAFNAEIARAQQLLTQGEVETGFRHLERAHVIGQAHVFPHVYTHWLMFKVEIGRCRPVAAWGQLVRIVLGALGSLVGVIPSGNTGGSDISMFKRMPVASELECLIKGETPKHGVKADRPMGSQNTSSNRHKQ